MANLKLKNPGGGSLNFVSADSASDLTVTFPATTGTAMVSGNMPAFSAYNSSTQSVPNNTYTLMQHGTERFDTNSNFASDTFTPTVAGYYQVNVSTQYHGTAYSGLFSVFLRKNGSNWAEEAVWGYQYTYAKISEVIYMNGTTDYLNVYAIHAQGSSQNFSAINFSACLVRAV